MRKFQRSHFRRTQDLLYRSLFGSNLKLLALLYGTDKWGVHLYAEHYQEHFSKLRRAKLNLLEIGIGGYGDPGAGGESLRMWRTYLPNAQISGIDIYPKRIHDERRITTFQGSQIDGEFLDRVTNQIGCIDIIIDDGSHMNEHIIETFKILFPKLNKSGFYVIEDLQTSYWARFGGRSGGRSEQDTAMGFLQALTDGLNHTEFEIDDYCPSYFDQAIRAIHFYHNIVFIEKV